MATNMYQDTGPLLTELDTNLVACALVHLQPADLAQVGSARCSRVPLGLCVKVVVVYDGVCVRRWR
jgi:hypothetical protein